MQTKFGNNSWEHEQLWNVLIPLSKWIQFQTLAAHGPITIDSDGVDLAHWNMHFIEMSITASRITIVGDPGDVEIAS